MGAPTDYYVDPAIAANSGTGIIGDPYGDVQYALDQIVRDAVNGDRLNVKSGTDEILAAELSFVAYGTPTQNAPIFFQGYTTAQGDGGIGGINGNANFSIINNNALDYVNFFDMHLHNTGANNVVALDNGCWFINCEIDNGNQGIDIDDEGGVVSCYVHDTSARGITVLDGIIQDCTLEDCDSAGIIAVGVTFIIGNIVKVSGAHDGIQINSFGATAFNNSVWASGGTGSGINARLNTKHAILMNNIIEGFSGVGGIGFEIASGAKITLYGHNAFFNNTTNLSNSGDIYLDLSANDQILTATPFVDAPSDDFRIKTNVNMRAYPTANYPNLSIRNYIDIGALQRIENRPVGTFKAMR